MLQPFDLNLRHLRALDAIVTRGSMSAAAEAVSLSQPALTQGLAKLERQLEAALFERRPDGMTPTREGLVLALRASAALAHLAAAARAIARGGTRGFARPEQLMTATQLRAFLALADAGSFVSAAQATALSEPALHRAVRDLEQLGATVLVERRGRGVTLTAAGRRLARGVRLAAGEIAAGIAGTRPGRAGPQRITVGAMPLSRAHLLPIAISGLVKAAPGATIDVVEGSWRELVEPLRDGVLDLMVGALREEPPADLSQRPLLVDPLSVIARAGHPLAGPEAPDLDQLARCPWVVGRTGTPLRTQWEQLWGDMARPEAPIECGSVMIIREILRDSNFLTLLAPAQVSVEIESRVLTTIGPPLAGTSRTIGITTRAGWRPTELQERFIALLEGAVQRIVPKIQ